MRSTRIWRRSIVISIVASVVVSANTAEITDDFERFEIGDDWSGHRHSFSIQDGTLVASQIPDADHGAVIRAQLAFRNVEIDFDVRFEGGERFNFVIDDKNCKEVHAGHICRVSITRKKLTVQDDRTGVMNLELRELRKQPDMADQVEAFLESTRSSGHYTISKKV